MHHSLSQIETAGVVTVTVTISSQFPHSHYSECRLRSLLWPSPYAARIHSHDFKRADVFCNLLNLRETQPAAQSDLAASLFVYVLYSYQAQEKYRLHEFVVTPDHVHFLITIASSMTIERAVQFIEGGFAFSAGKELGLKAPNWQKGFQKVRVEDYGAFARVRD